MLSDQKRGISSLSLSCSFRTEPRKAYQPPTGDAEKPAFYRPPPAGDNDTRRPFRLQNNENDTKKSFWSRDNHQQGDRQQSSGGYRGNRGQGERPQGGYQHRGDNHQQGDRQQSSGGYRGNRGQGERPQGGRGYQNRNRGFNMGSNKQSDAASRFGTVKKE